MSTIYGIYILYVYVVLVIILPSIYGILYSLCLCGIVYYIPTMYGILYLKMWCHYLVMLTELLMVDMKQQLLEYMVYCYTNNYCNI